MRIPLTNIQLGRPREGDPLHVRVSKWSDTELQQRVTAKKQERDARLTALRSGLGGSAHVLAIENLQNITDPERLRRDVEEITAKLRGDTTWKDRIYLRGTRDTLLKRMQEVRDYGAAIEEIILLERELNRRAGASAGSIAARQVLDQQIDTTRKLVDDVADLAHKGQSVTSYSNDLHQSIRDLDRAIEAARAQGVEQQTRGAVYALVQRAHTLIGEIEAPRLRERSKQPDRVRNAQDIMKSAATTQEKVKALKANDPKIGARSIAWIFYRADPRPPAGDLMQGLREAGYDVVQCVEGVQVNFLLGVPLDKVAGHLKGAGWAQRAEAEKGLKVLEGDQTKVDAALKAASYP